MGTVQGTRTSAAPETCTVFPKEVILPPLPAPVSPPGVTQLPCARTNGRRREVMPTWRGGKRRLPPPVPPPAGRGRSLPRHRPAPRPGPLPAAAQPAGAGPRCAALYGRCPWQGLCLLPAARRRRAWGAGAAARRQLPWPSPQRRTSCRCPVSGAGSSQRTGLRVRVVGTSAACGGPRPLLPPRRRWAPSPAPQRPPPCPGLWSPRSALGGRPRLSPGCWYGCPAAPGCGPPARPVSSGVCGGTRPLTSDVGRGEPRCRQRGGVVPRCKQAVFLS